MNSERHATGHNSGAQEVTMTPDNTRYNTPTERGTAYQTHDGKLKIVDEETDADAWIRGEATEVRR